jgi:multidrug efflux pump subunit AcrB
MSHFFINRPIFASVLSIIVTLAGAVALPTLPVAQYPEITPPTVQVTASYPGANSQTVLDTVAQPVEQQVNGVEQMMYMSSQATNDGNYTLTVTFKLGTDLNMAQVLVQNRVALALPTLPPLVQRLGVSVKKKSPSQLMIVNLFSPDGRYSNLYLSNYATIQIRDELARLDGVADVTYLGQRDYSMRVWLDPEKVASRGLSVEDVILTVQQQNVQVAAGQIGQPPVPKGQAFQYTLNTLGRLADPEQFAEMVLKAGTEGQITRLRDVSRIELGALSYDQTCTLDGSPSVALSVYQLPGSNALETAQRVREKMEELKGRFPEGLDYAIVYDTTPFIRESINEVFKALRDAIVLVAVVVLVFLQNWRSMLIPLVAVPVAIVGTFAVMALAGFSLNNLTLFGLVLAVGIVVDDAIVVVEAVEHHIEQGMPPVDATRRAMDEVSGPVVAIALVLFAVFVPCAFIGGITGQFFRQFAVTIAVSTLISAFNSLTLSPALAALLLRPRRHGRLDVVTLGLYLVVGFLAPAFIRSAYGVGGGWSPWLFWGAVSPLGALAGAGVFFGFNRAFAILTGAYTRAVAGVVRASVAALVIYGGLLYLTWYGFTHTPAGFIPQQDKGYLLVNVQLPDAASVARTREVVARVEGLALQTAGVKHTVAIAGQSLLLGANAPNFGSMYVMLDDFHERDAHGLRADDVAAELRRKFEEEIGEGLVTVFGAPPVEGLGTAGGFRLILEDRAEVGPETMQEVADQVVEAGNESEALRGLFTSFRAATPWLFLDIDRTKARTMGVPMSEVFDSLQVYVGSYYVNDFNRFGRTWQVNAQADARFRESAEALKQIKVRNAQGNMIPLGSFTQVRRSAGPVLLMRYNMYPAAAINGDVAEGRSTGEAIRAMEEVASARLPQAMSYEWTEITYLQLLAGNTALYVFVLAVVLVFLVLAAQYESWTLPLAVILVVPMCLFCSVAGVALAGHDINIFTQIGFVVLVGLASKNAILIVEFAKLQTEQGKPVFQATLEASRLRLRPILMTSFAFILGVVPLLIATGAGAEMRRTLGTAVFWGMLGVTLFGVFLTPVFFFVVMWLFGRRARPAPAVVPATTPPVPVAPRVHTGIQQPPGGQG